MRSSRAVSRRLLPFLPLLGGLALLALLALPAPAGAAPGSNTDRTSGSPANPGDARRVQNDVSQPMSAAMRALPQSVRIEGKVHDKAGKPLEGFRVRLFWNGMSLETVTTDVDGSFLLSKNPPAGENNTTDLWIVSPDPERYVDVNVILSEGRNARDNKLFSACTATVDVTATGATVDVTMLSPDEQKQMVQESRCLESEPD